MVRLLSASLQHRHLLVRELQRGCRHVFLKVRDGAPLIWQTTFHWRSALSYLLAVTSG
jgi:hypothetical protein